jgi:hypothetical protein
MNGGASPSDGDPDFDRTILVELRALPLFRLATDEEIDRSYAAYGAGDSARLCDVWQAEAAPTRADLGRLRPLYERASWAPSIANGLAYLATVRAALDAGRAFRAQLSPPLRASLLCDFPWLERRHEHVPPGFTPPLAFPDAFRRFVDTPQLDAARARWQLCAALNEVMQAAYSRYAATLFRLPPLCEHAARERAMALNYFAHWSPPATRALWRQCVLVLDGLNAATFGMLCREQPAAMIGHALFGALARRSEWRAFVDGLQQPPWLLPPPGDRSK